MSAEVIKIDDAHKRGVNPVREKFSVDSNAAVESLSIPLVIRSSAERRTMDSSSG
jgi:hypothetical protein